MNGAHAAMSALLTVTMQPTNKCPGCGAKIRARSKLCRKCVQLQATARLTCPECGGPKYRQAKRCTKCYYDRSRVARESNGRTRYQIFKALLDSCPVKFTTSELADITGLSYKTIWNWMHHKATPRQPELDEIAKALSIVRCPHCAGTGYIQNESIYVNVKARTRIPSGLDTALPPVV